jgi:hypothetical protein
MLDAVKKEKPRMDIIKSGVSSPLRMKELILRYMFLARKCAI